MPNGLGRLRRLSRARSLLLVVLLAAAVVTVSVSPARADSWRSVTLFAEQVMPALRPLAQEAGSRTSITAQAPPS
jgi:hypothetical protein